MQRVVRSTLVGLLTLAGLTACGDKVTVPPATTTPVGTVVHSVTVTPSSVTMKAGDKVTLVASVDADAGVTDRTVTWTSSNTTVATVDANGVVTAVAGGTASIIAASKADASVKGAAAVTVGANVAATVTISTINQFNGFTSVPANLASAFGQLDVTLNVDPGTQQLAGVDLVMNCAGNGNSGQDTVVATQNLSSGDKAPVAEESNAPVTLSFNTASFNATTGAVAFHNGACTLKAKARTTGGTQTASSTTAITLNNQDAVIGTLTSTKTATDAGGLAWNGGDVTVTAIPVLYTANLTAASITLTFEGRTQTVTGTGAKSATFTDGNGANPGGATDIDQITDPSAVAGFQLVDSNGNNFTATPCGSNLAGTAFCTPQSVLIGNPVAINSIRLDTQKPKAGTFLLANNQDQLTSQDGYVGANFKFLADSASGYRGPDAVAGNQTRNLDNAGGPNGVDKVTVVFQTASSATSTFTSRADVSGLSETNTSTSLVARMITTDALGNADTSWVNGTAFSSSTPAAARFGVDKTAPTATLTAGPANQATSQTIGGLPNYTFTITDNLSGPSVEPPSGVTNPGNVRALVAITRNWNGLGGSSFDPTTFEGKSYTNTGVAGTFSVQQAETDLSPCFVGRFNASQTKAGANALPVFDRSGNAVGFCTPIGFDLLAGGTQVPSDVAAALGTTNAAAGGYYATEIIFVDQAGNQVKFTGTGSFPTGVNTVAEDGTNPTVSSLDLPGSITGGSTVSIPASASDNLDITGAYAQINYTGTAAMSLRYPTTAGPGVAFDNTLTRSATISPTITGFIKNLQQSAGVATTTPAAGDNAQTITECAVDVSNRSGCLAGVSFAPAVSLVNGNSNGTTWSNSTFTLGFALTAPGLTPANTIWNCPAPTAGQTTGCGLAGTTVPGATAAPLTATAAGTTSTFNNPFVSVSFWYQGAGGVWVQIPNSTVTQASVQDTGVGGQRTWTFTFTWDPPASGPDGTSFMPAPGATIALPVRAIGINSNGDGLVTPTFTLTISNQ